MARRDHAADGHRHRHRAAGGRNGLVAHAGEQPFGRHRQFVGGAAGQDDAEFVAGEAAEMILAAQPRADALGDLGDHLVGGVEAVGFVEPAEMVDGDQQEAAGAAEAQRRVERGAKHLGQLRAVHLAGERIVFGELDELTLAFVARVDRAHHAVRAQRLAVGPGKPAAGILQPDLFAAVGVLEGVLHLIGNAGAAVALAAVGDRVAGGCARLRPRRTRHRRGRWRSRRSRRRARQRHCRSSSARRCPAAIHRRPRRSK